MTCPVCGESECKRYWRIAFDQGATYDQPLRWDDPPGSPVDLTTYSARMHVRAEVDSDTLVLELTTGNGRIVLGGAAGTIQLLVSSTDAEAMTPGDYVYDLEMVAPGDVVTRIMEGNFVVLPEVTR